MKTRQQVETFAESHGIELEVTVDKAGKTAAFDGSNVHAFAPNGKVFRGSGTRSASLWDSSEKAIDWDGVQAALQDELPLEDELEGMED